MIGIESIFILLVSPLWIAGAAIWFIRFLDHDHRRKSPVTKKITRYPGYSLMRHIEGLTERLEFCMLALVVIPAITLALVGLGYFNEVGGVATWFLLSAYFGMLAVAIWILTQTAMKLIRAKRGLRGELIVGNELARLWQGGFQVFHDFPIHRANIDHVAVGPGGVFAIETKYRRKWKGRKDGHTVRLKGDTLQFPTGSSSAPVLQSRRQAEELAKALEKVFGVIIVTPVLILPGWYVEEDTPSSPMLIGSAKRVIKAIKSSPERLDAIQIERVSAYLRNRCSDVEV